jgi:hypothetical protein
MSTVKWNCPACQVEHTGVLDRFSEFYRLGLVGSDKSVVLLRSHCTKIPYNTSITIHNTDLKSA